MPRFQLLGVFSIVQEVDKVSYKNYIFKGPLDRIKVVKSIEKFYNGFEYKIS